MAISQGTRLGHYEVRSAIGAGGMGEVYLAQDIKLERTVALKILPAELALDEERMRRFVIEARAAAALNHPHIAHIYEIGEADGTHFIAMEYIDGQTLREKIHREKLPLPKLLRYLAQVAQGLAKAHAAGIVHRDLKPDNIMVSQDNYAKILDFGLAKLVEPQQQTRSGESLSGEEATVLMPQNSLPGMVLGTVGYMSPEQAEGRVQEIDQRSDIFSFGCILFEAVTRKKAFEGKDVLDSLHKIVHAPTPQITDFNTSAPAELQRMVRRCLAKDPEKRYQGIKEVAIELEELRQELKDAADAESSGQRVASSGSERSSNAPTAEIAQQAGPGTASMQTGRSTSSAEYLVSEVKRHKLGVLIALFAVVIGAVGFSLYLHAKNTEVAIESIAVLPFDNQSHDPDSEYLSDGVTESIINSLTQIPNVRVIARSSVFHYKGKQSDPLAVGKELGVRAVLTGRIIQRGDTLTVSVELMDVRDNKQLWGEQYNRKLADLMAMQSEIAHEISEKLRLKLSGAEQKRMTKRYTDNVEAYQLFLKGSYEWNKFSPEGLKRSIEYYNQALEKDPNYALAYCGLAACYSVLGNSGLSPREAYPKATAYALKGLEIDESLAPAHTVMAAIKINYDWDWIEAEKELKRALELNPNDALAHHLYAYFFEAMGRLDEAKVETKRAQELDPMSLIINADAAYALYFARQYDEAIGQARKTLDWDPQFRIASLILGQAYEQKRMYREAITEYQRAIGLAGREPLLLAWLGHVYAVAGQRGEADKALAELKEISKQQFVSSYLMALIYDALGDREQALASLERAEQERFFMLIWLKVDPRWDSLRSDPRFADLVRKVGL